MAIQKVKFTSESITTTQTKINENFSELDLGVQGKQDIMQFSTMPAASASYVGKIVQFVGTTGTYTNGYFYVCELDDGSYVWTEKATQEASKVTLNGVETSNASFYAPTTAGTSGKVLKSNGDGNAPTWQDDTDTGATSVDDTGSGNAYTSASYDATNRKITFTKGETFQTATDNSLDTTSKTVVGAINEVNTVAKNANIAKGYTNYSALITELNSASATAFKVGQSLYVQTQEVPDLWIISIESSSSTYTYTTDAAFITATAASGGQQVGYYKLAQLETQKVDLSNYVQKTTTIAGVDLQDNITVAEMQTALSDSTHRFVTDTEKSTWSGKQDAKTTYTFTASDAGWSAIDNDGYYTLTIASAKKPFVCYNSSGAQVLAGLSYDGTNIYVVTDTKFAGSVEAF